MHHYHHHHTNNNNNNRFSYQHNTSIGICNSNRINSNSNSINSNSINSNSNAHEYSLFAQNRRQIFTRCSVRIQVKLNPTMRISAIIKPASL